MPTAKVVSPSQKTRKTQILGRKLSVEFIHTTIEKGINECQKLPKPRKDKKPSRVRDFEE